MLFCVVMVFLRSLIAQLIVESVILKNQNEYTNTLRLFNRSCGCVFVVKVKCGESDTIAANLILPHNNKSSRTLRAIHKDLTVFLQPKPSLFHKLYQSLPMTLNIFEQTLFWDFWFFKIRKMAAQLPIKHFFLSYFFSIEKCKQYHMWKFWRTWTFSE